MVLGNWTATDRGMKPNHYIKVHTKISTKLFKDLNVRPETTKLLEENKVSILFDIGLSSIYIHTCVVRQGKHKQK